MYCLHNKIGNCLTEQRAIRKVATLNNVKLLTSKSSWSWRKRESAKRCWITTQNIWVQVHNRDKQRNRQMTAQMRILLVPSVFSHVFSPPSAAQHGHAHPGQRQHSLTAGAGRKGCPIGATKDFVDRGPQQGSSHCRDAVSHQNPPAKTT